MTTSDMAMHQARLPFADADEQSPVVVAYGAGVDSTALIIERHARGERIDMALRALMPEKLQTLEHIEIFEAWMDAHGIPHETVSYMPSRFKHWPPYRDLLENCLTNGTLPSIAFGRHSCSLGLAVESVLLPRREEGAGRTTR